MVQGLSECPVPGAFPPCPLALFAAAAVPGAFPRYLLALATAGVLLVCGLIVFRVRLAVTVVCYRRSTVDKELMDDVQTRVRQSALNAIPPAFQQTVPPQPPISQPMSELPSVEAT